VEEFKYFVTTVTNQNSIQEKIKCTWVYQKFPDFLPQSANRWH